MRLHDELKPLYLPCHNDYSYKCGRVVSYLKQLPLIKPHGHIITWSGEITSQTKIVIYPVPQCLLNLVEWRCIMRTFLPWSQKVLWLHVLARPREILDLFISTATKSMFTRRGNVVTSYEKLPSIKSYNPLNTWSDEVMW